MESPEFEETCRLVTAAKGGDRGAVDRLFDRYYPITCKVVAVRLGRRMSEVLDHEDLVQSALMRAFKGLEAFEYRCEGSFRHYLSRIVENELCDQWRRATAQKRGGGHVRSFAALESTFFADSMMAGDAPTPSQELVGRELEKRYEEAILALEERPRQVFGLRKLCGLEYEEIATELEIESAGTVRSIYSRALVRLSELL